MEAQLLHAWQEIKQRLDRLDFNAIWPGFQPCGFALYNGEQACLNGRLIPRDERFFGNTAIQQDGAYTAIWMLENAQLDFDALAASLVHEMFHAHQMQNKEQRFPDDLEMLLIPHLAEAYALKQAEVGILAAAMGEPGEEAAKALAQVKALREKRRELWGGRILQEFQAETIEGLAVFTEMRALDILDSNKQAIQLEQMKKRLTDSAALLFDTRRCAYFTGCLLAYLALRAGIDIFHPIGLEKITLYELIAERLPAVPPPAAQVDSVLETRLQNYLADIRAQFSAFTSLLVQWKEFPCQIAGYDPMNMLRSGDRVLMKTIVFLDGNTNEPPLRLEGQTLLDMAPGSSRQVLRYARQQ